ncbi:MAG: T9SS type A sorting domain-containing protein [Salinivirgaceae bacterium]|nr:T9SS type A sorting domain-containing protein [Salinivirgaceae bacterium]
MLKKALKTIPAIALLAGAAHCQAQTTVTTAGGEAGTVSFTVGQTFVAPASSDAGSITPGVQQAYEISVVNGIENTQISLEAEVYPNPTADRLTLSVVDTDAATLHYTLTDANGRTIAAADIIDAQTSIDMGRLTPAVYLLRVDDGAKALKTFRIVKR